MSKSEIMSAHVQAWQSRNISAKAYCEEVGIALQVFYYWRKKLEVVNEASSDFILLKPDSPHPKASLIIKYPNGIEIEVPSESQITLIRSLIQL